MTTPKKPVLDREPAIATVPVSRVDLVETRLQTFAEMLPATRAFYRKFSKT